MTEQQRPRVWFRGETVPGGIRVIDEDYRVYPDDDADFDEEWTNWLSPVVELTVDYDAEVARAEQEKADD